MSERGFTKLVENATLPTRGTKKSMGYDFYLLDDAWISADPEAIAEIPTGITCFMPDDEGLILTLRSSLSKKGLMLANGVGVIDADYNPNEIKLLLRNFSGEEIVLDKGSRVMQGIFIKFQVSDDEPRAERTGGLGSTGV